MKKLLILFLLLVSIFTCNAQYTNKNYIVDNNQLSIKSNKLKYNIKAFDVKLKKSKDNTPKIDFIYTKKLFGKEFSINTYYNSKHLVISNNIGFIAKLKLTNHFKISILSETDQMYNSVYYISGKIYYIF